MITISENWFRDMQMSWRRLENLNQYSRFEVGGKIIRNNYPRWSTLTLEATLYCSKRREANIRDSMILTSPLSRLYILRSALAIIFDDLLSLQCLPIDRNNWYSSSCRVVVMSFRR